MNYSKDAHYNDEKREFLVDGFKNGFTLGYSRMDKVQITSRNLKFLIGDEIDLWNKVHERGEIKEICWTLQRNSL